MTDTAPRSDTPGTGGGETATRLVRVAYPAPAPASAAPATTLDGIALVTLDRPGALNAISFDLLDELVDALERLDRDPTCRAIVITGSGTRAFAAGADIRELETQTSASLACGRPVPQPGTGSRRSGCRSSPRSAGTPLVVAASSRWPATWSSPRRTRPSASPRS